MSAEIRRLLARWRTELRELDARVLQGQYIAAEGGRLKRCVDDLEALLPALPPDGESAERTLKSLAFIEAVRALIAAQKYLHASEHRRWRTLSGYGWIETLEELLALPAIPPALPPDDPPVRAAVDSLLQRRGVPILDAVRTADRELGYQVGMLLGEIARILNVNDPSLPPVSLRALPAGPAALPAEETKGTDA